MGLNLKPGDRVRCAKNGEGTVEKILQNESFPFWVQFDDGTTETYTSDGRMHPYGASVLVPMCLQAAQDNSDGCQRWICKDKSNGGYFISAGRYRDKKRCEEALVDATPVIAIPGS